MVERIYSNVGTSITTTSSGSSSSVGGCGVVEEIALVPGDRTGEGVIRVLSFVFSLRRRRGQNSKRREEWYGVVTLPLIYFVLPTVVGLLSRSVTVSSVTRGSGGRPLFVSDPRLRHPPQYHVVDPEHPSFVSFVSRLLGRSVREKL